MVWAVPVSLAATKGIARTFFLIIMAYPKINLIRKKVPCFAFYSSGYWDVSLPQVRILIQGFLLKVRGFPHSEISGSKVIWHLAETYRSHITSFIASYILGIHLKPLHSCKECCTPPLRAMYTFTYEKLLYTAVQFCRIVFSIRLSVSGTEKY